LEPEVYSLAVLETLIGYTGVEKKMTIHIKLDTGMHRLGFEKADISELGRLLREHPNLKVASVFSHLSASDNPAHDDFTHRQASAFTEMYTAVAEALGYHPLRHIANTSGISRFPEYHFDMVRLGIGLYGIDGGGLQNRLQVVNVLKATVSQVKNIPAGDTVGYNRNSGLLNEPRRTATISIGYADGFLRVAGGGRYKVLVNNQLAPTIGNICMDMTMIDVTHIPGVKAGDEVVVFGENPLVQCLAETQQTIPYEIFTNISERVKRVYVQE
jgi:alanine racemase